MKCSSYFPCYNHICASNKYAPQMPHIFQIHQLLCVQTWPHYVSIYTSYELTAINNETRSSGIHASRITGICHWTNMPAPMHIYVPLDFSCNLHTDPNYYTNPPHINKLQHIFTILLQNMCQQQICNSNATCMPHARITQYASVRKYVNICHI